jgi:hypothetical protein
MAFMALTLFAGILLAGGAASTLNVSAHPLINGTPRFLPLIFGNFALASTQPPATQPPGTQPPLGEYLLVGWNDLGMHCYDSDFSIFSILPPYNNLWAQVIRRGDPPQVVTAGVKIEYSFPGNTTSTSKTNFWQYVQLLLGANKPPDIGLKDKGLSGELDPAAGKNAFVAEGVPITEFSDSAPTTPNPLQVARLVVKDTGSGKVLAQSDVVAPVSSEMRCDSSGCHSGSGKNGFRWDILAKHDEEEGTTLFQQASGGDPILCGDCHAAPALGLPGVPEAHSLSAVMHGKHFEERGEISCYNCHPGQTTRCLRDVMSQPPTNFDCRNCHTGGMQALGNTNRQPWADEPLWKLPRDSICKDAGVLYAIRKATAGCIARSCHNSTHAILPSRENNDNLQSIALQGYAGTIGRDRCTVCHLTHPTSGGPHQ